MQRNTRLTIATILSFGLVACGGGGGGGGGGNAQAQPQPAGNFAGTWEITATSQADAAQQSKLIVTMTVDGLNVRADDGEPEALEGTIRGLALTLKRGTETTIELFLPSAAADTLTGTGSFPGGETVRIDGKRQAAPVPTPKFAGTWDMTLTSKTDPTEFETLQLVIELDGDDAEAFERRSGNNSRLVGQEPPRFAGKVVAGRLRLEGKDLVLDLSIGASDDELIGTASFSEGEATIQAARNKAQAIALQTGRWTFELQDPNSSPLFFNDGTLTQDGAKVRFVFSEAGVSQTFEGDVTDRTWAPAVTGTVSFEFTGEFRADGEEFSGTYTSLILGNGTITGRARN